MGKSSFLAKLHANNSIDFETGSSLKVDDEVLVVNASSDSVGIGTDAPAEKLDIVGTTTATRASITTTTGNAVYQMKTSNSHYQFLGYGSVDQFAIYDAKNAAVRLTLDGANGHVTVAEELTANIVYDHDGDLRRAVLVTANTDPFTVPVGTSSVNLVAQAASNTINVDNNNMAVGDVVMVSNFTGSAKTINFSNFTWVRKAADDGTGYTTLTLEAYGVATINKLTANNALVVGNV